MTGCPTSLIAGHVRRDGCGGKLQIDSKSSTCMEILGFSALVPGSAERDAPEQADGHGVQDELNCMTR